MKLLDKVVSKVLGVFCTLVILAILLMLVLMGIGIKPYVVMSGSMEPQIQVGSMLLCNTKYEYDDIDVDDVIMYSNDGTMITHRVIEKSQDGLVTKGDANEIADGFIVTAESFRGKVLLSVPKMGYVLTIISGRYVKFAIIAIMLIVIIASLLMRLVDKTEGSKKEDENNKEVVTENQEEQVEITVENEK